MARVCTVCSHPRLLSIDRQLLRGDMLNAVAHRFHVSPDAVGRHRRHMRTAMLKAQAAAEKPELIYGQTLIDEVGVGALDNAKPNRYFGPSVLDRTHQFSFGGYADLPRGLQLAVIGHFWSQLSASLVVPNTASPQLCETNHLQCLMNRSLSGERSALNGVTTGASTPRMR